MNTFYISEMSVSDQHGGGLTLQRVLGDDLKRFDAFFHVSQLGCDYPPATEMVSRGVDLPMWIETPLARRLLSGRGARWLCRFEFVRRLHARRVAKRCTRHFSESPFLGALVVPQGLQSLLAIEYIGRRTHLNYVTWIMDDHLVRFEDGDWVYPEPYETLMRRHLRGARTVLVISQALGEFYNERFGIESITLFGPAPVSCLRIDIVKDIDRSLPLRLAYFGRIWEWQLGALLMLAEALESANAILDLYAVSLKQDQWQCKHVRVQAPVPANEVYQVMRRYDAVVLPISFDQKVRNLAEFNIATKMSECLSSGVPVFAIGPPYSAMMKFLAVERAAMIVTNPRVEEITAKLNELRSARMRRGLADRAMAIARGKLSTTSMRNTWGGSASCLWQAERRPHDAK